MKDLLNSATRAVRYWWVSLLIGVLAILLSIWTITTPDVTLVALSVLFITVFIVSGILEICFAVSNRQAMSNWGWLLTGGIIDLLFGGFLLFLPLAVTASLLIYFIGFWIMFRSVWTLGQAFDLQQSNIKDWGWLLAIAILGILFSIMFITSPLFASGFVIVFVSISFAFYGIFRIYLAFKLRSMNKRIHETVNKIKSANDK